MLTRIAAYLLGEAGKLACFAVVFALLETFWPAAGGQRLWRRESRLDLAFSFLVPVLAAPLFFVTLLLFAKGLRASPATGWLVSAHRFVSARSFPLQVLAAVFIADLSGYWRHRILHSRLFWPFHAIHHSSQEVDWLSNERVHPAESVLSSLEQLVVLQLLGFGPEVAAINSFVRRAHSLFEHSNVRFSYGPLNYIFVSPRFHRWHHSDDPRLAHKNFANFFSCIDLLFGTFCLPEEQGPRTFGLFEGRLEGGFLSHMLYPFREYLRRRRPAEASLAPPPVPLAPPLPPDGSPG